MISADPYLKIWKPDQILRLELNNNLPRNILVPWKEAGTYVRQTDRVRKPEIHLTHLSLSEVPVRRERHAGIIQEKYKFHFTFSFVFDG